MENTLYVFNMWLSKKCKMIFNPTSTFPLSISEGLLTQIIKQDFLDKIIYEIPPSAWPYLNLISTKITTNGVREWILYQVAKIKQLTPNN